MVDDELVGPPSDGVTEVEVEGAAYLHSVETNDVVVLNQTASDVWFLCDGSSSAQEIVDRLAQAYDLPQEQIKDDVLTTIASFRRAGLLPS